MPQDIVAEILALEAEYAAKTENTVRSKPGPPASDAGIAAAEQARERTFPASYRAFLARTDGWQHFSYGMMLFSSDDLVTHYDRGYIEEMIEDGDEVPEELAKSLTIGWSQNDARLYLLLEDGAVVEWFYEEEERFASIDMLVKAKRDELKTLLGATAKAERTIEREWDPKHRAKAEAKLAGELRKVLAKAKRTKVAAIPKPKRKRPPAVRATDLVGKRGKAVVAEVALHLVLYLGAYPSAAEVLASYRAWRSRFPVRGTLEWMYADESYPHQAKDPDDESVFSKLRVARGHFGLRASIERKAGRKARYIINVRGIPADNAGAPRASFCEVIVPASESAETLAALARDLLAILPVRSGHAGYAAYVLNEQRDAEPDPWNDVFAWCRRFWGLDVAKVDGWLPGVRTRLHNASWLTLLGPAFAGELARAKRLRFAKPIVVERLEHGAVIRVGNAPSLVDVARGEPAHVGAVDHAIEPLLLRHYDERGWVSFGGHVFTTMSEDLDPFRSHRATQAYLGRFLDPAGWLAPTVRELAEGFLAKLAHGLKPEDAKLYKQALKGGDPDFEELARLLFNAANAQRDDQGIAALTFLTLHESRVRGVAASLLLYVYLHRKKWKPAIAAVRQVRPLATQEPGILHNAACIYARAGEPAEALDCIAEAKRLKYDMKKLRDEEYFESLHSLPAWKRLFR